MVENEQVKSVSQQLKVQAMILGGLVGAMWALEVIDRFLLQGALDPLGIRPRTLNGLWGILLAPFLHGGLAHVAANTLPFIILGWLVMMRRLHDFFLVTLITLIVSGLGIWLTGPSNSVHIGASGLVFGYFGFLLLRGYFERSLSSILWSVVVGLFYGGLIWGALPQGNGISWQAHLFGFIGGGIAAYWLAQRKTTGPLY
jgi:membrane associated rhomboid family serine protease